MMVGKVDKDQNNNFIVRWTNGKSLLTGKDYVWECEIENPDGLNIDEEVEFEVIDTFKAKILNRD